MQDAPTDLKLIALDAEDLAIVSAHMQDAFVRRGEIVYLPAQKRFVVGAKRYDWSAYEAGRKERVGAALRFERVLKVAQTGLAALKPEALLNLLAVSFVENDPPSGIVTLTFSGGAAIRLEVECLEAELRDIGPRDQVSACPGHALADEPQAR
ncbi:MAG TPA: DUF2948 family protein [Roseiarcus sp.]|nr:DUF2948 family protein [Roseiarcus sp.]